MYFLVSKSSDSSINYDKIASILQAQVDNTIRVMRENINKVSQRGERLDLLQNKTDGLAIIS
jgi:hypothetical protein